MAQRNFADPDYEPTDEDLVQLAHEAFADVAEAQEAPLRDMRERIRRGQAEARRQLRDILRQEHT